MPIQLQFEPANNLIYATFSGEITPQEILHNTLQVEPSHPEYQPGMDSLVDLSTVKFVGVNFDILNDYATHMPEIERVRGHCRWALVSSNLLNYGILRMFTLINGESALQIKAFKSLDDGRAWLLEEAA